LVANLLAATLAWPVTRDEARIWLQRLSRSDGPALVLAIDGVRPDRNDIRRDIEELASNAYGDNVRIVFTLDDTVVRGFRRNASGRGWSVIGRAAVGVEVEALSDVEFQAAQRMLWEHRIGFVPGVDRAAEMRAPWVLRSMVAAISSDPKRNDENLTAALPPMLGIGLIDYARERFDDPELRRRFQALARAMLTDSTDKTRPIGLMLESVGVFMVRHQTLESEIDRADIDHLIANGLLKAGIHESGEAVLVAHLPELLASELAGQLAREIASRARSDVRAAALWLAETSRSLPLGDVVAAQAISDAARRGDVALNFVTTLLETPPREERIKPGTKFAMQFPRGGMLHLTLREDGSLAVLAGGEQHIIPADDDEEAGSFIADIHSWLILSHLAARPSVLQTADGGNGGRLDPGLLLVLGTCPHVLRGPQNDPEKSAVLTHQIPGHGSIVCHHAGIVEPVTMAIYFFLGSVGPSATDWVEEAVSRESFPLLMRVNIALRQLVDSADTAKGSWAKEMIESLVTPALKESPLSH
jgi:hypothetical protein